MTEKRTRTYPLEEVKNLIRNSQIIDPGVKVRQGVNDMGLSVFEAHQEILKLEQQHLYKSVTEIYNNKVWQDVYKKNINGMPAYIKFKVFEGHILLTSFKPDEG